MEWLGILAFVLILCYSGYPSRVQKAEKSLKNAEKKIKALERNITGGNDMSDMIKALKGKKCKLTFVDYIDFIEGTLNKVVECTVIDADDEWMKISFTSKKANKKSKEEKIVNQIVRIENINSIELSE
ncbi:MAG: hypothetical protein IKL31_04875 [Ruminococcus sp.]|nr:hypothetical protein [Ruminococcus sp.]